MQNIESNQQFEEVIKTDKPVLVDFFTQWCGPCRTLTPIVEEVSKDRADSLVVCKIDGDNHSDLMQKYDVTAVPTMLLFKDTKVIARHVGVLPKDSLLKWIDDNAK